MLRLKVAISPEGWDEEKQEFVEPSYQVLQLEHSLVSLSKWESKWHKSFLHTKDKTYEETMDYIKCMTITQNVNPEVYDHLSQRNVEEINNYINNPMTATTFAEDKNAKANREIVTAEIIYNWMFSLQIPMECQKWHLNRLIAMIRVSSIKNSSPKKMNKRDILSQNAAINAARRQKLNSKG